MINLHHNVTERRRSQIAIKVTIDNAQLGVTQYF